MTINRYGDAVQHRDGDAVGDVETGSADFEGVNFPFTNGRRLPTHLVEQEFGGDLPNLTRLDVCFRPCEFS